MAHDSAALDSIDRRIIDALSADGRISWRELAERVHLVPSSVGDRVRRLEERGVIRGYSARIDPEALGRGVRAVIDVSLPPGVEPDDFEALLANREEVSLAMYVTGPSDYTIIVDCDGAPGLDAFVRWLKADAHVARTESRFVLRPVIG